MGAASFIVVPRVDAVGALSRAAEMSPHLHGNHCALLLSSAHLGNALIWAKGLPLKTKVAYVQPLSRFILPYKA